MNSPVRFFLFGYFGQGNLGDDLLLQATVQGIKKLRPDAAFVVRNEGEVRGLETLGAPIELTNIDQILADSSRSKTGRLIGTLSAYFRYFKRCNYFVFSGGTLFHERYSIIPLGLTLLVTLVARLSGLKVFAIGVGVADLKSNLGRLVFRAIVFLSDLFVVRDQAAYAQCIEARAERVEIADDLVFGLFPLKGRADGQIGNPAVRVGLSLYPYILEGTIEGQQALQTLKLFVSEATLRNWEVILLSFQETTDSRKRAISDSSFFSLLTEALPPEQLSQVKQQILSADPDTISNVFSTLDIHCGLRFHGHVLSAIYEKPFVGISHDNKIDEICRKFGMPCIGLPDLTVDLLFDKIHDALSARPNRQILEGCVSGAASNFSLLSAHIDGVVGEA